MGMYDKYCIEMNIKRDIPPIKGKSPVYMFGQDYFQDAFSWTEVMTITDEFMMMEGTPKGIEKIVHVGPDGHKGGPYPKKIHNAEKVFLFCGTDHDNPEDLGATVEFHLGEGENEEVLKFNEPRAVFVPRNLRHGPVFIKDFHRNLNVVSILNASNRQEADIETDFTYDRD